KTGANLFLSYRFAPVLYRYALSTVYVVGIPIFQIKRNHTDGDRLQNLHKKQSIKPLSRIIKNEPQKNL
ncbi:hypothetical protein AALD74_25130, partial [Lachnospiraceae bacterium 48-21]